MMVGRPIPTVARYTAKIITVDQALSEVGFVVKGDAAGRKAIILTTPIASRWPVVGETWLVRQENGTWYLEGPLPSSKYSTINPGDAIIDSPTGITHILSDDHIITFKWTGSTIQFYVDGNPASVA